MAEIKALENVEKCPHCSVATPLLIQVWMGNTPSTLGDHRVWGAFACTRCGYLVTAASINGYGFNYAYPDMIFPKPRTAHEDIPSVARTFLQQAFDTLHSPEAAALMAGSAVDAMLKELGYKDGSVYVRIDEALRENKLTQGMADWAHSVRLGANRPRHADSEKPHVTLEEAKQSVEFADALGNFLFVLSAKIERGLEAARQKSAA